MEVCKPTTIASYIVMYIAIKVLMNESCKKVYQHACVS